MKRFVACNVALFAALGSPFSALMANAQSKSSDIAAHAPIISAVVPKDAGQQFVACAEKTTLGHKGGTKHMGCTTDFKDRDKLSAQFARPPHHHEPAANVTLEYLRGKEEFTVVVQQQKPGEPVDTWRTKLARSELFETQSLASIFGLAKTLVNTSLRMAPME